MSVQRPEQSEILQGVARILVENPQSKNQFSGWEINMHVRIYF